MILNKLPPEIHNQVFNLLGDEKFQDIFSTDKVLDLLQSQKHNKDIEFQQLQLLLYKRNIFYKKTKKETEVVTKNIFKRIVAKIKKLFSHKQKEFNKIEFKPITLALYSYLYTLKSNIIFDVSKIDMVDLDLFFYLLQTKDYSYDYKNVLINSCDYCKKVLNLNYNEVIDAFNRIYSIQFRVFSFFPKITTGDEEPAFSVDWMLNIISKIKPYVSYTNEQLYTQISVMELYYYYAHFLRNNGDNSIFIRSEEEILDEIDSRTIELVLDRLIQKKVITYDQHDKYFDLMKQVKEN